MATPTCSGSGSIGRISVTDGLRSGLNSADSSTLLKSARATTTVAIDVGTYGSGFAYVISPPNENARPTIKVHTDWPDRAAAGAVGTAAGSSAEAPQSEVRYPKTRSALLLRGGKGVAFGWTAVRMFCEMNNQERTDGRYYLVYGEDFKLGLQDPGRVGAGRLPEGVSPESAFTEFLRLMKVYILEQLLQRSARDVGTAPAASAASVSATARGMIRWCLTVPALWSDEAKGKVRRAAHRAALITKLDSDELTVVLEPEAAALQVSVGEDRSLLFPAALLSPLAAAASRYASTAAAATSAAAATAAAAASAETAKSSSGTAPLRPDEVFMVVDAGGGTVDITIHEIVERSGTAVLSEAQAVPGLGEMVGSTNVDAAFATYFRSKVGEEVYDTWRETHPGEWMRLLEGTWEQIKCDFDSADEPAGVDLAPAGVRKSDGGDEEEEDDWAGGGSGAGGHRSTWRVYIPPTLHAAMDGGVKADLLMEHGLDDSVVLDRRTLAEFFKGAVQGVIKAAQRQLDALAAAPRAPATRCSKVMLVGGFGCSRYLQSQLVAAVGGRVAPGGGMLVPEHPASAVMRGAVLYGLKPELVRARSSRMTYGVRTAVPYEDGMPAKFWHPAECCYYSAAGFSTFVARGQLVAADEVVTHVFTPLSPNQQVASVELWATDQQHVRWIDAEDMPLEAGEVEARSRAGGNGGSGGGMRRVGEVQVDLTQEKPLPAAMFVRFVSAVGSGTSESGGDDAEERLIEVSLEFGRTEIRVTAQDMLTGKSCKTRVKFAFSW